MWLRDGTAAQCRVVLSDKQRAHIERCTVIRTDTQTDTPATKWRAKMSHENENKRAVVRLGPIDVDDGQ